MVKIRLARHGKRNDPHYRVVVIDSQKKNQGEPLEVVGFWYPKKNDKKIDKKSIEAWVAKGAQISQAVQDLIDNKKPAKKKKDKKEKVEDKKVDEKPTEEKAE